MTITATKNFEIPLVQELSRAKRRANFIRPDDCYKVLSCPDDSFPVGRWHRTQWIKDALELGYLVPGMILEKKGRRYRVNGPPLPDLSRLPMDAPLARQTLEALDKPRRKRPKQRLLGDFLRAELERRSLTQRDLAAMIGWKHTRVWRLVNNRLGISKESAEVLAKALDMEVDLLLELNRNLLIERAIRKFEEEG